MTSDLKKLKKYLTSLVVIISLFFVWPFIIVWLWNGIVVDLLNVGELTYWNAMGLFVLCNILFKSKSSTIDGE